MLVTLLLKINKTQAFINYGYKNGIAQLCILYMNKAAHKKYRQHKIEFNAKLNLCSAVKINRNLITLNYKILKIWTHCWNAN